MKQAKDDRKYGIERWSALSGFTKTGFRPAFLPSSLFEVLRKLANSRVPPLGPCTDWALCLECLSSWFSPGCLLSFLSSICFVILFQYRVRVPEHCQCLLLQKVFFFLIFEIIITSLHTSLFSLQNLPYSLLAPFQIYDLLFINCCYLHICVYIYTFISKWNNKPTQFVKCYIHVCLHSWPFGIG